MHRIFLPAGLGISDKMSENRIIGIDVARALAVIGMIIVNFKIVFGDKGSPWLTAVVAVFDGKAAATFVVLAGVAIALMTNSAIRNNDRVKLATIRKKIAKRAVFLLLIGMLYLPIWSADILHFYGVYMLIMLLFLACQEKTILWCGAVIILAFPLMMMFFDYEAGWNFVNLNYLEFWSLQGFSRNLFFNGFHPVIPWAAFIFFGYWLGKQALNNSAFIKKIFIGSLAVFVGIQALSYFLIALLSADNTTSANELAEILSTHPMPPLPLYMINGVAFAFMLITACITLAKQFKDSTIIQALTKTGQLALTFYVAHVVIGMGIIEALSPTQLGHYHIGFSLSYAIIFSLICILFAIIWTKYQKLGPIEWLMRKLTA